ncbi:MAG: LysM peptidoglycan-binding domain-containing protein, partial [Anaerolineae bacterium]|nr:LysM peptidoglycan-binding domain-containing protein [Anaerolineae bacterium]
MEDSMVSKSRLKFIIMAVLLVALLIPVLPAAAAPDYQGGVHVVQRGENLSTIAQSYGISQAALAQANGISNPNLIYVGQRLVIPGAGSSGNAGGGA